MDLPAFSDIQGFVMRLDGQLFFNRWLSINIIVIFNK